MHMRMIRYENDSFLYSRGRADTEGHAHANVTGGRDSVQAKVWRADFILVTR